MKMACVATDVSRWKPNSKCIRLVTSAATNSRPSGIFIPRWCRQAAWGNSLENPFKGLLTKPTGVGPCDMENSYAKA